MEHTSSIGAPIGGAVRQFFHRLIAIGENRFELLAVEIEQERNHLLDLVFIGLGTATFSLLALMSLTAAIVVAFWDSHPVIALLIAAVIYLIAAAALCLRLLAFRKRPPSLSATFEQLRKDSECIRKS